MAFRGERKGKEVMNFRANPSFYARKVRLVCQKVRRRTFGILTKFRRMIFTEVRLALSKVRLRTSGPKISTFW
ncbi:hypothetical protein LINPERHAP1_LOCUS62, partial [Linum perenne]